MGMVTEVRIRKFYGSITFLYHGGSQRLRFWDLYVRKYSLNYSDKGWHGNISGERKVLSRISMRQHAQRDTVSPILPVRPSVCLSLKCRYCILNNCTHRHNFLDNLVVIQFFQHHRHYKVPWCNIDPWLLWEVIGSPSIRVSFSDLSDLKRLDARRPDFRTFARIV